MTMGTMFPDMIKYEVTYTLINDLWTGGNVVINYETTANAERTLKLTIEPHFVPALTFELVNHDKHFAFTFMYDINTHGLPLICNDVSTCNWSVMFHHELDFGNEFYFAVPTTSLQFEIAKDMNNVFGFSLDLMKNPLLVTLECPLILTAPIELSLQYDLTKEYGLFFKTNMFYVPLEYTFMLQKDLKAIEVTLRAHGIHIIDIKGTGDVEMEKFLQEMIKYEVSYKIVQGLVAEGIVDFIIDMTTVEKMVNVTVHTTILPAVAVELRCYAKPDYSFGLSHSLLIANEIIYAMEHKNTVTLNNAKWTAVYTDKLTVPTTSMVYKLVGSTYLGELILNFERLTTVEIDMNTPTVFFYNFNVENSIMMTGTKHFAVGFSTIKDTFSFTIFYPVGMDIMGYNAGFKQLIGQDDYTCQIAFDAATNEITVQSGVFNFKIIVTLPEMKKDTMLKIKSTFTENDITLFVFEIETQGPIVYARFTGKLDTATVPILSNVAPTCLWTTDLSYEVHFDSLVFHLFPAYVLDFSFKWDDVSITEFHTDSKVSPVHYSLTVPALFSAPMEISLPQTLTNNAETIIEAAVTINNIILKSIFELDQNLKIAKIHIPMVADPVFTITWLTTDALKNTLQVKSRVPHYMTISDITADWKCQSIVSCAVKSDAALMLPVIGDIHFNTINTIILSKTKSQLSMKASNTNTHGLISVIPPVEISLSWVNNNLINNHITANLKSASLGEIFDLTTDGRCKSLMKCSYKSEVSGGLPNIGKYHFSNSISYLMRLAGTKISSSTSANFSGGLLTSLPPVKHSLTADCDFTTLTLDASTSTSVGGTTVGLVISDTKNVQLLY